MGTGKGESGDNSSFEAVEPSEETIKSIFEGQKQASEKQEISREDFMILLEYQRETAINYALEHVAEVAKAQAAIVKADNIQRKIATLENNKLALKFLVDGAGNLYIEPSHKKQAGFMTE